MGPLRKESVQIGFVTVRSVQNLATLQSLRYGLP